MAPQPGAEPDKVVPPQPKPKNQGEAWEAAATKQTHWRVSLAKAFKQDKERQALLAPFAEPSAELLRLVEFARAFPLLRPGPEPRRALGPPAQAPLPERHLPRLDAAEAKVLRRPFALLVLADAKVLAQSRFLLTPKGWQRPPPRVGRRELPRRPRG